MKRIFAILLSIMMTTMTLGGCEQKSPFEGYSKYRSQFYGTFDTMVEVVAYAKTDEEFEYFATMLQNRFIYLHNLYSIFEDAEGFNNLKTVNDQAGIAPVRVDKELFDLMQFTVKWYEEVSQSVDPTMGPLLKVWRDYMDTYKNNPEEAVLPDFAQLESAAKHMGMDYLVLDEEAQTIFLAKKGMALDVGAVAKGYATERVAQYMKDLGFDSFSISAGGNVRTVGEPKSDVVSKWGISIQDPHGADIFSKEDDSLDIIFVNDMSVVTSGNYQRYYIVDDRRIHHIIDQQTLYPANLYSAVTVVTPDSGAADILSTCLYIMDQESGAKLAAELGAEVMWVYEDGTIKVTEGIVPLLKTRGGATSARSGHLKDFVSQ